MKTIIRQHERGLVYRDGQLTGWLEPGKHRLSAFFSDVTVETINIDRGWMALSPELDAIVPENAGARLFVPYGKVAAISVDHQPADLLGPGRWILWQVREETRAELYSSRELISGLPVEYWSFVERMKLRVVTVRPTERVLVYVDGSLDRVLDRGRYLISHVDRQVELETIEMREQELQVVGQEVMTRDKVSIRVNVIVKYQITDPIAASESVTDLRTAIYAEAQMSARKFVAGRTVDEMLESRHEASAEMAATLRDVCGEWGVQVRTVDLKDVILPGDMKMILNQVIEAEKRAEANVIYRREETAATRSLANTAKMLEKNPTLLRLKELEATKEIVFGIDKVTLVSNSTELLGGRLLVTDE